jgi:hypothetical protein
MCCSIIKNNDKIQRKTERDRIHEYGNFETIKDEGGRYRVEGSVQLTST